MSEAYFSGILGRIRASRGTVSLAARKYGLIAVVSSASWAVAVAVIAFSVDILELPGNQGWSDLLMLGLASIFVVCGSLIGMEIASTSNARSVEAGTRDALLRPDEGMLEIRGLSLVVGNEIGIGAWHALRDGRSSEHAPTAEDGPVQRFRGGPHPLSPLARAMQGICDSIPCTSLVPILVWPPEDDGVEPLNPVAAIAELGPRYASLCFISMRPETKYGTDVNEAIFSVFDQNPTLPMLLVVSADGPTYRPGTSSSVTSSVSAMFITKRDNIETAIRPFAVEKTPAEAACQSDPVLSLFLKATNELDPGRATGLRLDADVWRSKIEPTFALTPEQNFPGRSIFAPVPWRLRELHALDNTTCLGLLRRSVSTSVSDMRRGPALPGGSALPKCGPSGDLLDPNDVQRALIDEMPESRSVFQLVYDILNPVAPAAPSASRAVINVRSKAISLGNGASLATLAYAVQATKSSGGATLVIHVRDDTAVVATVLPFD
ncbi:MAG TPA: hypothetical protein VM621_11500 [Luteibacter sp.]|uniref:hypothetical protein n=1 Tax=Luteibacter sp. TaxID=1886636 RepID=UPI002C2280AF|nr:hypothetical protein [Luteibacter sp.]HVI55657.1 hypothetical protein [Luteibacter sp.]